METIKECNKTKGELGAYRRTIGVIVALVTVIALALSGFEFYEIETQLIWAGFVTAISLLVSGIAKDVVAIAKSKIL